ncbi:MULTISPECIES: hypothetical protein [Cellulosimicrobium]|uniref:Proteinase inhibitor I42 chagasin domain-containing protein n=1 Tax=Cellulosimicrobium sp. ES-005 TaxID=3163031 RepID=A0AAU8G199_9MICO|nr:hypothetical protein [Cellulosimicrobium cellulans]MCO7275221.1 hypothetical protein [Cellulosimicrobium cellulans]
MGVDLSRRRARVARRRARPGPGGAGGRVAHGRRGAVRALVVLALAALPLSAGAAWATWSASQPVSGADVRSGSFGVETSWQTFPDLTAMLPGQSRDGVVAVTHTGDGTWRYRLAVAYEGTVRPTVAFYPGATCTGTALPAGALSPQTYARGATTQVCVRYTLPAGSPSDWQGQSAQVAVTVTLESRPS